MAFREGMDDREPPGPGRPLFLTGLKQLATLMIFAPLCTEALIEV